MKFLRLILPALNSLPDAEEEYRTARSAVFFAAGVEAAHNARAFARTCRGPNDSTRRPDALHQEARRVDPAARDDEGAFSI
jgi:hypothetical protein